MFKLVVKYYDGDIREYTFAEKRTAYNMAHLFLTDEFYSEVVTSAKVRMV